MSTGLANEQTYPLVSCKFAVRKVSATIQGGHPTLTVFLHLKTAESAGTILPQLRLWVDLPRICDYLAAEWDVMSDDMGTTFVCQCPLSRFSCNLPHSDTFHPAQRPLARPQCLDPKRFLKCDPLNSPHNWESRPPPLPRFNWASENLMDLMATIDAPLLHDVLIGCFHVLIFNISQPRPTL